jgi:hypothetical protein
MLWCGKASFSLCEIAQKGGFVDLNIILLLIIMSG